MRSDHGCGNLWAIDLNCYMVMAYRSLAYMADRLSLPAEKRKWLDKAETLGNRINETLWSDADRALHGLRPHKQEVQRRLTPASFMPLCVKIATPERAKAMYELAKDQRKFFPACHRSRMTAQI